MKRFTSFSDICAQNQEVKQFRPVPNKSFMQFFVVPKLSRENIIWTYTLLKFMKKISEICDKTFTVKSAMKKHAASVHEKKKPFKCE